MDTAQVFNPAHYGGKDNPYETIKVLEAWLTPDEMIGFCKGNSIKYKARHRDKGGLIDLSKALWYDQFLVQYLAKRGLSGFGPVSILPEKAKEDPDKQPAPASDTGATPFPPSVMVTTKEALANAQGSAGAQVSADVEAEIAAMAAKFAPTRERAA